MVVASNGSYGIEEGLIYSYPEVCKVGGYTIAQVLTISDFIKSEKIESENELKDEAEPVKDLF